MMGIAPGVTPGVGNGACDTGRPRGRGRATSRARVLAVGGRRRTGSRSRSRSSVGGSARAVELLKIPGQLRDFHVLVRSAGECQAVSTPGIALPCHDQAGFVGIGQHSSITCQAFNRIRKCRKYVLCALRSQVLLSFARVLAIRRTNDRNEGRTARAVSGDRGTTRTGRTRGRSSAEATPNLICRLQYTRCPPRRGPKFGRLLADRISQLFSGSGTDGIGGSLTARQRDGGRHDVCRVRRAGARRPGGDGRASGRSSEATRGPLCRRTVVAAAPSPGA